MKLVTFSSAERSGVGVLTDDGVLPTGHADLAGALRDGQAPAVEEARPIREYRLHAPVRPGKIICAGINYRNHLEENPSAVLPTEPFFFAKLPSAVVGPDDAIRIPHQRTQVDYEVELAVVIGRRARNLSRANALSAVFGYTLCNDVSARDIQFKDNQITLGKGLDTFAPLGPCVVTADEIEDPQRLRLWCTVNGETRQDSSTAQMLFQVAELLEHLSRHITLEPGDVVTTGTPAGVGAFRNPPTYLSPGDVVEIGAEGIGVLRNPVQAGW